MTRDGSFVIDAEQQRATEALDEIWHCLVGPPRGSLWDRLSRRIPAPCAGLYLCSGVGRGKTWLMDLFFDSLPFPDKQRVHFHRFMQQVHNQLRDIDDTQDPLQLVGANWAKNCRVLCLDEFFVSDIADAMLLSGLLDALFQNGVTLVTTSNIPPDDLYGDGLQRAKFLPAIELIKQHSRVFEVGGEQDFRLRILEQSDIYHHPLDDAAVEAMNTSFERMTAGCVLDHHLRINARTFVAIKRGDGVVWFGFEELCLKPRGSIDYIEIAKRFNTVMISNVIQMTEQDPDPVRRFVTMIDEFYDRNVKLLMSAAVPLTSLYTGKRLQFEFQRTESRLTEMQSRDYLARPHLP